ncbi:MAG: hypothetical protein JXQ30_05960 [Spirochaetes bacterium]|nr:hypothetical protein [Spirochaetota bacterium]
MRGLYALSVFLMCAVAGASADDKDAYLFFERIQRRYETIADYQCRIDTYCTDGQSEEHRILNFYFKRPRLIRVDLLWGNMPFDNGSVGVFTGGDTITGHRGGILSPIIMTIPKKSTMATTLRGEAFDEIDMEAVLEKLFFYMGNGTVRIGEEGGFYRIVCVPLDAKENGGITKDIARFDRDTLTITGFQRYESGVLVQEAVWTDYIINAGLPDRLFDVKFDPKSLKREGILVLRQSL